MKLTQADALALWRHVLVTSLHRRAPDLTVRQMALLLTVYTTGGPHTVRGLAEGLRISKPAVTRALDRLGELDFLRRKRDEADRRNVLVQRTDKGSAFLGEFAAGVVEAADSLPSLQAAEEPAAGHAADPQEAETGSKSGLG